MNADLFTFLSFYEMHIDDNYMYLI